MLFWSAHISTSFPAIAPICSDTQPGSSNVDPLKKSSFAQRLSDVFPSSIGRSGIIFPYDRFQTNEAIQTWTAFFLIYYIFTFQVHSILSFFLPKEPGLPEHMIHQFLSLYTTLHFRPFYSLQFGPLRFRKTG